MSALVSIFLQGDGCWPDLEEKRAAGLLTWSTAGATPTGIARMPGGMASGLSSVAFRFDLEGGRVLVIEAPMRLVRAAIDAFAKLDEAEAAQAAAAGRH
jgi:hypothetical protein